MKLKIVHCNIRGFISKKESLAKILETLTPDICNLNETNMRGKRKIKLKNYASFIKNREVRHMGGISTSYQNYLRQYAVKVSDNAEGDEYLLTRLENVEPALNMFNIYGQTEGRAGGVDKILDSWGRIKKELALIEARGEAVLILGDLNRAVGAGEFGVAGNKPDISYGGKLVRDLVASGDYVLFNNLALVEGGPWTREDPADGGKSCLDLAIGSKNLEPYLEKMLVDSAKKFTPKRVTWSKGKMSTRLTDHFSLVIELKMPRKDVKKKTLCVWNKQKPGGWNAYEKETEAVKSKMEHVIMDKTRSVEEVMNKLDSIQTKIKHKTLGKTKVNKKKNPTKERTKETEADEDEARQLMRKQSQRIESEILKVTSSKMGRCGELFKMRDVVAGPKKAGQDAQAVIDSRSGELVVASSAIQKASLEYCLDTLEKNVPKDNFKGLIEAKRKLHDLRMLEDEGEFNITEDLFWLVVDRFEKKKKKSYDFLSKASKGFKEAMLTFCRRMHSEEKFPRRFWKTTLIQLYKQKGPMQQLSSHRFLHMKEWTVRLMESLEVEGMKSDILEAGTQYQLGGKPGMRAQFHLFVVKSILAMKASIKEGTIVWSVDLEKFFDKEVLVDCLDTLATEAKVDARIYRNWYRLNQRCLVSVVTGSGITEEGEAGEVVGQGSGAASLVSQLKVDCGLDSYFSSSKDEECYGGVRLQPLSWQDDILGLGSEARLVQASLNRLSFFVDESQLSIHPDPSKSSYIVVGNKKSRQETISETDEYPLMVGKVVLERSQSLTYLGEILHENGLAASASATIDLRVARVRGAIFELKAVCEDYRMQVCGGMVGAINLYESCIVPRLLANSGVWVDITSSAIKKLDATQNLFVQALLRLPSSTVLPSYRAETGLLGMKWRIWESKLLLMMAIKEQEDGVLARQILDQQLEMKWPGLSQEVAAICQEVGLANICQEPMDKKTIKEAIFYNHLKELKIEMKKYQKLDNVSNEDFRSTPPYMKQLCLEQCRMVFRLRTNQFRCRVNMPKLFGGVLWCHSCSSGPEDGPGGGPAPLESQSHLELCVAYSHLREGKDLEYSFKDKTKYFMELSVERDKQKWN